MDNQNNKKTVNKKGSIFSFIAPYLLILLIVVAVIYFFGGNSNTTARNYGGDVGNFTTDIKNTDYEYQSIKVSVATEVVTVTGIFTDTATDIVYNFTLVADKSNRDAIVSDLNTFIADGSIITYDDYFAVSLWEAILPYLILGAISIVIVLVVMSRSGGGANAKAFDFGKTPMKNIENSKVRFADVAGCDEEKAELVELVDYLKNPRKFAKMGARIPKGVLLEGAPGTGKTLLAKAVAGEAGVPFFSISGSDFVEMFVGVGASRVRDMFKKAQQYAPSMLFIDEIDAVGRQRGTGLGGGHDEREQTLNQLLAEMDGFPDNAGIIVIAATNRPDVLDPALLRPGRFDRRITVNLPDRVGRTAILKVHARNKKFAADVDFTQIAMRTPGFSGAELENVLNEAAILAVRQNQEVINMNDIDEAIDRVMGGPAKKSKIITPKEKKLVAYHEAGHAIVGLKLENAMKVQKVTIIPRGDAGGYVLMTPNDDRYLSTKTELLDRISGLLAGRVSEEIFFGDVTTGASSDIESATKIARAMVCELGMSALGPIQFEKQGGNVFLGRDYTSSQRNFSGQVAYAIDQEIEKIMNSSMDKARAIIEEFKEQLTLVAETLLTQETLTNEEVVSLVNNGHLPVQNVAPVSSNAATPSAEEVKPSEETKN